MPLNKPRVGEGTLQRVVLARQHAPEVLQATFQHLDAAGIVLPQILGAAYDMQRRALDGAGLGEDQGAGRQVEGRQAQLARNPGLCRTPAEPPGDHQVEDQIEIALQLEDDPLAQPAETQHLPVLSTGLWAGPRTGAGRDSRGEPFPGSRLRPVVPGHECRAGRPATRAYCGSRCGTGGFKTRPYADAAPRSLRRWNRTSDVGAGFKPARVRIALSANTACYGRPNTRLAVTLRWISLVPA